MADSGWVPVDHIKAVVARHYKIGVKMLEGESRERYIVKPRHIAMSLCRELTSLSTTQIGRRFGGRDHSTVINATDMTEINYKTEYERILEIVKASHAAYHQDRDNGGSMLFWLMLFACDDVRKRNAREIMKPAQKPVFTPRKAPVARIVSSAPTVRNVTASLMGDPGARSARVDRGELSSGNV